MEQQLTKEEKDILLYEGWEFINEEYIYIPDDWDGCMAYGIKNIRKIIEHIKRRYECKK